MLWPMFFLALAFCGIAVLGVLAVRVGLEVRRFTRAVGDSSERITRAAEELERAAGPLAGRAGATGAPGGARGGGAAQEGRVGGGSREPGRP
ncbi:hypothetical protein GCM10012287_12940 [Streptomyces daqingensis]|uniref:DUF948 domain-containing protein n=1 Tax=Streptomyces daqingensis TaxID=1472640 RepID=A0ABQ2M0E5_9ACTN|nr:hypothetical protein [Streptomyces daqingensis]GGO45316.1 hypothetical protein GCM10012287_12940 [Streptomyces daqingensis]